MTVKVGKIAYYVVNVKFKQRTNQKKSSLNSLSMIINIFKCMNESFENVDWF